jgi:predicted metal-dependent peptidase
VNIESKCSDFMNNYDDNNNNINKYQKSLVCIYTNKDKNEFAIGLKEDENFRAMTRVGESYTRFVDAYDQMLNDKNEIDWKQALKRWIAAAKGNETIFVEVDLSEWNEVGERKKVRID